MINKYMVPVLFCVTLCFACGTQKELVTEKTISTQKKEILAMLSLQEDAWNRADIDAFMESYWKSDRLKFIGSRGLSFSWDTTIKNYKSSYPTPEKMGKLTFTILDHDYLSATAAHITGKYELIRKEDQPSGYFTLVLKKMDGVWKIVSDHTSG